jgi:nucleolar protein 12
VIGDKHIRVDLDSKDANSNDFETSIFIGNLPYVVNEEELRAHFADAGKILNVRVIRDKDTFIGKGIAYIQFSTPEEMKKAVESKNDSKFKGRDLRVKRATPLERREKKERKKRERKQ